MRSDPPEELDRMLDQALGSYSSVEPRHGLEQRVLTRVRLDGAARSDGWWRWAVAIPLLAAVLIVALVYRQKPQPRGAAPTVAAVRTPVEPPVVVRMAIPPRPVRRPSHHTSKKMEMPKRDVFPQPSRLSAEERAVLTLLARYPEEAQRALAADERSREPIKIDRIEIPLLAGGTEH